MKCIECKYSKETELGVQCEIINDTMEGNIPKMDIPCDYINEEDGSLNEKGKKRLVERIL